MYRQRAFTLEVFAALRAQVLALLNGEIIFG